MLSETKGSRQHEAVCRFLTDIIDFDRLLVRHLTSGPTGHAEVLSWVKEPSSQMCSGCRHRCTNTIDLGVRR